MKLLIVLLGIVLLFILMSAFKIHAYVSLIIVSIIVGILEGIPITDIITSVKNGLGGTLGSLALIVGFGGMLGKLMAESGAAKQIALTFINKFGKKRVQWAIALTAFIIGILLFYDVGFVILIPLVFSIAKFADIPVLGLGIPMAAALSVTHGFLPPHPAPTAIAVLFNANIGLTLIYGLIIGIPTAIVAGPLFAKYVKINKNANSDLISISDEQQNLPNFGISVFTALSPVILMAISTLASLTLSKDSYARKLLNFIGDPVIALLVGLLFGIYTLGIKQKMDVDKITKILNNGISSIAVILLVTGAGGAFKQVLIDSGVGKYIGEFMKSMNLSIYVSAWLIAVFIRLAVGSATVAGMTAASIVAPMLSHTNVSPELITLAIGAGSIFFSHLNDSGFWLFKEYFNLNIGETLKSWSILETIISIMGLMGVLFLNLII